MPDIDLRASGQHEYRVVVDTEDSGSAEYTLRVPEDYLERIGADDRNEPVVARIAAELLLDEAGGAPAEEIWLDRAEDAYPGFDARLRAALRP